MKNNVLFTCQISITVWYNFLKYFYHLGFLIDYDTKNISIVSYYFMKTNGKDAVGGKDIKRATAK